MLHIRKANWGDLSAIEKLQRLSYPNDAVPFNIYEEWYNKNSSGFYLIENVTVNSIGRTIKNIVGHFTFLAIKKDKLDSFLKGVILETEIRGDDLYSPFEIAIYDSIYVESVILSKNFRVSSIRLLNVQMPALINLFCGRIKNIKKIYAMASTKEGSNLVLVNGFQPTSESNAPTRKDKHYMYEMDFNLFYNKLVERERKYKLHKVSKI